MTGQNKANAKWALIARDARARLAEKTINRLRGEAQLRQAMMAFELNTRPFRSGVR